MPAVPSRAAWTSSSGALTITGADTITYLTIPAAGLQTAGFRYGALELENGEIGFFLVSDGTGKPYKCRCRAPSFANTQPLSRMVEGRLLSDLIPTFDMINMIGGECDR